jgi:integrase
MLATCTLILYNYRRKNVTPATRFPVYLRVTYQRYPKTYSLRIYMTEKEFSRLLKGGQVKEEFQQAVHFLDKAIKITQELREQFSWEEFEARFYSKKVNRGAVDLFDTLEEYAEKMQKEGRIKTFQSFQSTISRIRIYHKNKRLPIRHVTSEWLFGFAEDLRRDGLSIASVGTYTRNIRTIFNWEISRGRLQPESYPFGRNKFKPPSSTRVKKALNFEDVQKIFDYQPRSRTASWCRDLWLFSYLGNGMNIKDIALLRYENIVDSEIHFVRAKTLRKTIDNQRLVHVHLHPHMLEIIRRWGNPDRSPRNHIFRIMDRGDDSPLQEARNVNQAVKTINKHMKEIGAELGLSKLPTCNFARHTYSTVLKRANVPIEVISEALGHFSVKTTEIYLDSFESDKRAEISKLLLPVAQTGHPEGMEGAFSSQGLSTGAGTPG